MSFLLEFGLRGEAMGGLFDRQGRRYVVFDVDGVKQPTRRRSLVDDELRPPARRRRQQATAPGYLGRKRGERVRNRLAVQQAHTSEWLGTFGQPGNGDHRALWSRVRQVTHRYLNARELEPSQGILRLDGEFGHAWELEQLGPERIGYLVRCVDYRLVLAPEVQAVLAAGPGWEFRSPDSALVRQVFDVPKVRWRCASQKVEVVTRLVVARSPAQREHVGIGKQYGDWVYELFVTSLPSQAFDCTQVVELYLHRGGFEATLAQEDRECGIDRWVSDHGPGQEAWQLVAQWVWNLRLWHGAQAQPQAVRRKSLELPSRPVPVGSLGPVQPQVAVDSPSQAQPAQSTTAQHIQESRTPDLPQNSAAILRQGRRPVRPLPDATN